MEGEPTCCSFRRGNTIPIVRPRVANGTAREISPLSPEEHLRTEHQRVSQVSARPQCLQTTSATETVQCAEQRAEVMKQNRDEQAGRKTRLLNAFSIFPTVMLFFFPSAFSFHPVASLSLSPSISVSITSHPLSSSGSLFLSLSQHTHHDHSLISRERLV